MKDLQKKLQKHTQLESLNTTRTQNVITTTMKAIMNAIMKVKDITAVID